MCGGFRDLFFGKWSHLRATDQNVPDFVEKNLSAMGQLHLALLELMRASERAFFMTEELAFKEFFPQTYAIDGDKGFSTPVAPLMNRTCEYFLACAAFAEKQDGCYCWLFESSTACFILALPPTINR